MPQSFLLCAFRLHLFHLELKQFWKGSQMLMIPDFENDFFGPKRETKLYNQQPLVLLCISHVHTSHGGNIWGSCLNWHDLHRGNNSVERMGEQQNQVFFSLCLTISTCSTRRCSQRNVLSTCNTFSRPPTMLMRNVKLFPEQRRRTRSASGRQFVATLQLHFWI